MGGKYDPNHDRISTPLPMERIVKLGISGSGLDRFVPTSDMPKRRACQSAYVGADEALCYPAKTRGVFVPAIVGDLNPIHLKKQLLTILLTGSCGLSRCANRLNGKLPAAGNADSRLAR